MSKLLNFRTYSMLHLIFRLPYLEFWNPFNSKNKKIVHDDFRPIEKILFTGSIRFLGDVRYLHAEFPSLSDLKIVNDHFNNLRQ